MTRSSPPISSSGSLASIAAEWEDAMLHTCLSNDDIDNKGKRRASANADDDDIRADNDVYESFEEKRRQLAQVYSDSTVEDDSDSSDSDISLCRSSRAKPGRTRDRGRPRYSVPNDDDHDETDGDCSTISAVSSLANLFLGRDGPCSLHLDDGTDSMPLGMDTTEQDHKAGERNGHRNHYHNQTALGGRTNTRVPSAQPLLKKSSMKQLSSIGTTTTPGTPLISSAIRNPKRNVSFADVNFREYTVSLSQNPSCSEGPPIELGWEFQEQTPVPVEHYEEYKSKLPRRRRLQELVLSDSVRRRMLLERYTQEELTEAVREVEHLKRQRVMTYMMLPASALDEAVEDVYRYITEVFK